MNAKPKTRDPETSVGTGPDMDAGSGVSRRGVLRIGAATVTVGTVGTVPKFSPVGRAAANPLVAVGVAAAAGAATAYAVRYVADKYTGPDVDEGAYDEITADELHAEIREDGIEMQYYDDSTLTNLSNVLNVAPNAAYSDAKYAAIESMNLGDDEATVKSVAQDAIDDFYTVQQENLLEHSSFQIDKLERQVNDVDDDPDLHSADVWVYSDEDGTEGLNPSTSAFEDNSVALLDGTSYSHRRVYSADSYILGVTENPNSGFDYGSLLVHPVGTGSDEIQYSTYDYYDVWEQIDSQHTQVSDDIDTWISEVYPVYEQGEIDLEDMITSSELADMSPDEDGFSFAGSSLALLGIDGAEHRYSIELHDDDVIVEGTVYIQNQEDSLEFGTPYHPSDFAGTVWLAYEWEEYEECDDDGENCETVESGAELIELDQTFTILDGVSRDGESLDEVTFTSRNQQTTDTDIDVIREELDRIRELRRELEEERDQIVSSGSGGGFFGDDGLFSNPAAGVAVIVGAGAVIMSMLGND